MFGLSFGELLIVLVVALLVLGPTGLPKLAQTIGKGLREFRRATSGIRESMEHEFYKLEQEERVKPKPAAPLEGAVSASSGASLVAVDKEVRS